MNKDRISGLMKFEDFLAEAQYIIRDTEQSFMIIAFDISDFHYVNNQFGYDTGDAIIADMAEGITAMGDFVILSCREYSDHFICLCRCDGYSFSDVEARLNLCKKTVSEIAERKIDGFPLNLNFGVYYIHDREEYIISAVDKANVARRTGKGNYSISCVVYSEHLMDMKENSAKIIPIFDDSFRNQRILVFLQPKICSETRKIMGAEALSRLVDKDGKIISPAAFIPALEKTGKIVDLDFYVLSFVLKLIRSWLDKGIEPVPISFNLSRLHFYNEQLVENIKELTQRYDVPEKYVEIEVTESVFF